MLNSTMHSRKNEIMIDLKENLMKYLSEQESFKEICDDNIERLTKDEIHWVIAYICGVIMVISGASSVAFIIDGYSENTWVIFRNLLWLSFSGAFSYCIYFYKHIKKNKSLIKQWSEFKNNTNTNIANTKDYLNRINRQIY